MQPASGQSAASIAVVREFFEAWNAKDWARWGAMHADHAHHAGPDHAQPLEGRDAVVAAHSGFGNVFPDFRYHVTRIFAHDDHVCAEWTLTGTHRGPVPGPGGRIEPRAQSISIPGAFVFRVAEGQVAEYVGHVDFLGLYRQLGVLAPLSSDVGCA